MDPCGPVVLMRDPMKAFAAVCTGVFVLVGLGCSDDSESSTSTGGAGGSTTGGGAGSGGISAGGAGGSTAGKGGSGGTSAGSGGAGGSTAGSVGSGGTGTGGGGAEACNTCAQTQFNGPGSGCWDVLQACLLDSTCGAWFNCGQSCQGANFVTSCFEACDADAAAAQEAYGAVADCLCASCADSCSPRCN
jgi:hypothetical protein